MFTSKEIEYLRDQWSDDWRRSTARADHTSYRRASSSERMTGPSRSGLDLPDRGQKRLYLTHLRANPMGPSPSTM